MNKRVCPHCNKEFECNGKVFSNHVRWCSENPARQKLAGEDYQQKMKNINEKRFNLMLGVLKDFTVACSTCGKEFIVQEREKQFPKKDKYFCSRSCANKRERPQEVKDKIAKGLKAFNGTDGIEKKCVICGNTITKRGYVKTCSNECHDVLIKQNSEKKIEQIITKVANTEEEYKIRLRHYRNCCAFKFGIKSFPDEFDFELIKEHGWYSPSNKGNNLGGVSRDHMYSVKDGFENNVPPELLAHPANCRLVIHNENVSKNRNSCITLDELKERIALWDKKYNK
jgi:predicted nucleic acid-binding Zn ribbon protein